MVGSYDRSLLLWVEQMLLLWAFRNRHSSPEFRRVILTEVEIVRHQAD